MSALAAGAPVKAAAGSRLLLAENNAVNRQVAVLLLEGMGFAVDVVGDGEAAVAAAATGLYDAVLVDCQMPVMDGFDAASAIRHNEREGQRVPIIALTAAALESDRQRCLAAGMDAHIPKPLREEALAQALSRLGLAGPDSADTAIEPDGGLLDPAFIGPFRELARDSMPDLLHNLLALFTKDTPQELRALRAAAAAGDGDAIARVAHKLGGGAASLGATEMAATCGRIEERAHTGDLSEIDELLTELDRQTAAVEAELTRIARAG